MKGRLVLIICLAFRIFNAVILHNSFTPDEHWQGAEVAHWLVYGYGFMSWEWEPCVALRNILHPSIIAAFYLALQWLKLDSRWMVAYGPRIFLGSPVAAAVDVGVGKLATLWFGSRVGNIALMFSLCSWFNFYALTRTYSNCLEALFNVWGIYWWSRSRRYPSKGWGHVVPLCISLFLASLGIGMRPTAGILWVLIFYGGSVVDFMTQPCVRSRILVNLVLPTFLLPLVPLANLVADRLFYEDWKIPMINFASFNLFADPGKFYGHRAWHFYLVECPIVVFLSFLPFLVIGSFTVLYRFTSKIFFDEAEEHIINGENSEPETLLQSFEVTTTVQQRRAGPRKSSDERSTHLHSQSRSDVTSMETLDPGCVVVAIIVNIIMLSKATHKEYRLLLPFVPLLLPIAAAAFFSIGNAERGPDDSNKSKETRGCRPRGRQSVIIAVVLAMQVIACLATSFGYLTVSSS